MRQFPFHLAFEASQTERDLGPWRTPAHGGLAAQVKGVRDERGHPGAVAFEVLAFGRRAHQARPPVAGPPSETDFGIGLFQTHDFTASAPNSGAHPGLRVIVAEWGRRASGWRPTAGRIRWSAHMRNRMARTR